MHSLYGLRVAVLAALLSVAVSAHATIVYSVIDLGTLGGNVTYGAAINNSGQVTGQSSLGFCGGNCTHAFLYSAGVMSDLNSDRHSIGKALNRSGQVVGDATVGQGISTTTHAVLFSGGVMTDLGVLGQSWTSSSANGVNDFGWIVGDSNGRAFLSKNGTMIDIGTLGGAGSSAIGINNAGQITGSSITAGQVAHAFIWSDGAMSDLGAPTGSASYGTAINAFGEVTGYIVSENGAHSAFIYREGVMEEIGTLGGNFSNGYAINSLRQVVGTSTTSAGQLHAFAYIGNLMFDLNESMDALTGEGWSLNEAVGINDDGQIIANGFKDGVGNRALLLTPVDIPEPSTLVLLCLAAAIHAGYRTHRQARRIR